MLIFFELGIENKIVSYKTKDASLVGQQCKYFHFRPTIRKNQSVKRTKKKQDYIPVEDEDNDDLLALPSFICPSSEDKSREYLCKLWVHRSKFNNASKTLPLL